MVKARSKAACCAERMFPTALRRENRQRKPLKSVENVGRGDVLQVLGSMDSVEEACRKAGVRVESHDRMQLFLNAFVRVIAVESRHLARAGLWAWATSSSQLLPSALRSGRECSVETRDHGNRVCFGCSIVGQMNPSACLRGSGRTTWRGSNCRISPDEGVQELLHKAKYHAQCGRLTLCIVGDASTSRGGDRGAGSSLACW